MRKIILAGVAAIGFAGAALAATPEAFFGNTVVTTLDGASTKWFFSKDGAYTIAGPDGAAGNGVWTLISGELCVTPQGGEKLCVAMPADKGVGDTWQSTNSAGQTFTTSIVAGR